jgi:hypothetical protein
MSHYYKTEKFFHQRTPRDSKIRYPDLKIHLQTVFFFVYVLHRGILYVQQLFKTDCFIRLCDVLKILESVFLLALLQRMDSAEDTLPGHYLHSR